MADNSLITKAHLRQTVEEVVEAINTHGTSTTTHADIREAVEQKSQVQIITWEDDD